VRKRNIFSGWSKRTASRSQGQQQAKARQRREEGATLKELAKSYSVGIATIARLRTMTEELTLSDADFLFDAHGDDNEPWADEKIRADYEAALGRCMLAFNQLDNLLGNIIRTILTRLGRADMQIDAVDKADVR
jgi:hypothetical protein